MLRDRDNLDYQISWVPVFRGLGINIVYLGDFHDDSDPRDPGPKRFMEEKVYFEGARTLLGQGLPGDSRRRGERLLRRPLVPDDAEAGLLLARRAAARGPDALKRTIRPMGMCIISARRKTC